MDLNKIQPICELYSCIQTEGSMAGRPNILIRTTGCTHRCWFGEGGWCDSWYTSIHPEKGQFTLKQIEEFFKENKYIKSLMISGGSPTMHEKLVDKIITLFKHIHENDSTFITLETEGSHFIKTEHRIDLISLSPKFQNSVPTKGILTPQGTEVDQKFIDQHNKYRMNHKAIDEMFEYHLDYHFKPVVDRNNENIWNDIEEFRNIHNIPKDKTWVMPE